MIHWHYLAWIAAAFCFAFAVLGVLGAGMASRELTSEDFALPKRSALLGAVLILLTVAL